MYTVKIVHRMLAPERLLTVTPPSSVLNGIPLYVANSFELVFKSGWEVMTTLIMKNVHLIIIIGDIIVHTPEFVQISFSWDSAFHRAL